MINGVLYFRKDCDDENVIEGFFKEEDHETKDHETSCMKKKKVLVPHGFIRKINDLGELEFFGCFVDGHHIGKCWKSLAGGKNNFSVGAHINLMNLHIDHLPLLYNTNIYFCLLQEVSWSLQD